MTDPKLDSFDYSGAGLRQIILQQKQLVDARYGPDKYKKYKSGLAKNGSFTTITIKDLPAATYENIVHVVLNEMKICDIRYYTLLEPAPEGKDRHRAALDFPINFCPNPT